MTTPRDRFMAFVDTSGDCWLWNGGKANKGYGQFWLNGQHVNAHRAAYILFVGPIEPGMQVDHLCRVPACVNPAHLETVTPGENIRRGTSHVAEQMRQTRCQRGHEFRVRGDRRFCHECAMESQRTRRLARRVA